MRVVIAAKRSQLRLKQFVELPTHTTRLFLEVFLLELQMVQHVLRNEIGLGRYR
jgi:hypothetical protein